MTSRQRMLAALACQEPDHVPCSFMLFKGLHERSSSYLDFVQKQLDMGLDAYVQLPARAPRVVNDHYNLHGLPVHPDPRVSIREWKISIAGEHPILVKEYHTPAGVLRAEVRKTPDWRWGDHVPFLDDYIEPRSRKFLVESMADLEALRYLLVPPTPEEAACFREEAQPCLDLASEKGLLVAGGWGVGADTLGWLTGLMNGILLTRRQPELITALLGMVAEWNRARMQLVLEAGIDLYIKRAWYENCDFWNPANWRKFILPILQRDAALAHEHGAKFGYILTSSAMPLIGMIIEAGVDALIGVDPREYDLARAAEMAQHGRLCLWGGVNGHVTVERGTAEEVVREARSSLETMRGKPGFVLSPVDNIREWGGEVVANVHALISAWKSSLTD